MRRLWWALIATVPLLVGGAGTASAQMRGGGGGWHGGHFHDGRSHDRGFHHFRPNSGMFSVAPTFWWGAPYYPYDYPVSYYAAPYAWPVYDDSGPTTYIPRSSGTAVQGGVVQAIGGKYSYYCTNPAGYYPQVRNCAEGWLLVVPDDHASAVALQSKELNNAEQFAKANGCRAPVAKMNLAVSGGDNFEAFAVACESEGSMLVRCDKGQCRAS